jgi:hypothetical protein
VALSASLASFVFETPVTLSASLASFVFETRVTLSASLRLDSLRSLGSALAAK